MRSETIDKIEKIGVVVHKGGFGINPIGAMSGYRQTCALWDKSEEPTAEEMLAMQSIVAKMLSNFTPEEKKGLKAKGVNTVTLKKEDGQWSFRRLTWRPNVWSHTSSSLTALEKDIA